MDDITKDLIKLAIETVQQDSGCITVKTPCLTHSVDVEYKANRVKITM